LLGDLYCYFHTKYVTFKQRYGRALTQLAGGSKETAKPGRK